MRLRLTPEPENPHDPDAIRVEFEYEVGKFFHLGYIPNSDTICQNSNDYGACVWRGERYPQDGRCPSCGHKELERFGTATRIKDYFKGEVQAWVTDITGGEDGKSYGCNISIHVED